MKLTAAALLLLPLFPQADPKAEDLFRAVRKRVEQANTIRAEFTLSLPGEEGFELSGVVKAKGKDRWAAELDVREGMRKYKVTALCDGRTTIVRGAPRALPVQTMKPEEVAAEVRTSFATALLGQVFFFANPSEREEERLSSPDVGAVKDGGAGKVGDRDARVLEYSLKYDHPEFRGQELQVRLYVDSARKSPLKREISFLGMNWVETFRAFALDEELPDSDFSYQSPRRFSRARAEQLAGSMALFGHFTGRHPERLDDLTARPAALPAEVFWPPGGFLLGTALPADGWGRPFELVRDAGRVSVVSRGRDGKAGGTGDDEDVGVEVGPVTRRAVGAPTERLRKHYTARVQVQLLSLAVRAFRDAYGELPRKKAVLWERPEWAQVWPEGAWLPGARVPDDPWGRPYRMISDVGKVRVQVNDPQERSLPVKALTEEERAGLEKAARPVFGDDERRHLARLFGDLSNDDLDVRERAGAELKGWGAAVIPLLEERLKLEKDPEAALRLGALRKSFPQRPPAWMGELASLSITVRAEGEATAAAGSNERNASATLKTFASAQADFRANDRDGNKINDFWTGDVAGLYCMTDLTVKGNKDGAIKLVELSAAAADAAPLGEGPAVAELAPLGVDRAPKAGYHFRVMLKDEDGESYQQDTAGAGKLGKVYNYSKFAICAYPAEYGVGGTRTFIINEGNTVLWKDTEGEPVLEWPADEQLREGWRPLD